MKEIKRKTQEERTAETRTRLFEATLDCLQERGYHGASLSQILSRTGLSRGAWRHHFQNKKELIAAAAEYILQQAIVKTQQWADTQKAGEDRLSAVLDFIWENFYTGRHRDVWLEFNVACRTDAELREQLSPVLAHFHAAMAEAWRSEFEAAEGSRTDVETLLILTINTMRGMAVQSIAQDTPEYFRRLREHLLEMISPFIQERKCKES